MRFVAKIILSIWVLLHLVLSVPCSAKLYLRIDQMLVLERSLASAVDHLLEFQPIGNVLPFGWISIYHH